MAVFLLAACSPGDKGTEETIIEGGPLTEDSDGDGYSSDEDCDDSNSLVHPGAAEVCDGADNNCNGIIDEGVTSSFYADTDGDGFGDADAIADSCDAPEGHVPNGNDCDDADDSVYPSAPELCDGIDNDCDGQIDEDVNSTYYADADGDGFGDPDAAVVACDPPDGYSDNGDDCDDTAATAYPGGTEVCDELDNNCDGAVDEGVTNTYYADADADLYGLAKRTTEACSRPTGYAEVPGDCDDSEEDANPGAAEVCDEIDNDCDGSIDEGVTSTYYQDGDEDGYGDPDRDTDACEAPSGYVADDTDCDDSDDDNNPDADETCDGEDNDCDGSIDEDDAIDSETWFADSDGDGYGDADSTSDACEEPSGYTSDDSDCDDDSADISPDAEEVCDEVDNDCDGETDEGVLGQGAACPAESCLEILEDGSDDGDGTYYLDPEGSGVTSAYTCDMTTDSGGWTLLIDWDREHNSDTLSDLETVMVEDFNNMSSLTEESDHLEWCDYTYSGDALAYSHDITVPNTGEVRVGVHYDGDKRMGESATWLYIEAGGTEEEVFCVDNLTSSSSSYYSATEKSYKPGFSCSTTTDYEWTWEEENQTDAGTEVETFYLTSLHLDGTGSCGDISRLYWLYLYVR